MDVELEELLNKYKRQLGIWEWYVKDTGIVVKYSTMRRIDWSEFKTDLSKIGWKMDSEIKVVEVWTWLETDVDFFEITRM